MNNGGKIIQIDFGIKAVANNHKPPINATRINHFNAVYSPNLAAQRPDMLDMNAIPAPLMAYTIPNVVTDKPKIFCKTNDDPEM